MTKSLLDKKCAPCEGDVLPLTKEEAGQYLEDVSGWELSEDNTAISRKFQFKNFKQAMEFVNQTAELAEDEGHHPDIRVFGYRNVELTLSTHAIKGLSENDFILAAKINAYYE